MYLHHKSVIHISKIYKDYKVYNFWLCKRRLYDHFNVFTFEIVKKETQTFLSLCSLLAKLENLLAKIRSLLCENEPFTFEILILLSKTAILLSIKSSSSKNKVYTLNIKISRMNYIHRLQ